MSRRPHYAFIGFVTSADTVASPNFISGNRAQGIVVFRGSYARIVGNDISYNGANGVNVRESSSAQISDNTVNGNGQNGILAAQGSGALLGTDAGTPSSHDPTPRRPTIWGSESDVSLQPSSTAGSVASTAMADRRITWKAVSPVWFHEWHLGSCCGVWRLPASTQFRRGRRP